MRDDTQRIKRGALLVCTAGSFLVPYMSSSVNVALPSIGKEFAAGAVVLSWVTTSFILASAAFLLPFGRLADIHGRKRIFMIGIAIYTVSSGLAAVSGSTAALIAARVLQGMGGAMMAGANAAILAAVFPRGERGRVLGINTAAVYLGISVGPFLGGILTQYAGWRSIFLLNIPVGIFLYWLLTARLRGEWAGARGQKFDLPGAFLYGFGLLAVMLGFSRVQTASGALMAAGGAAVILAFLKWEAWTSVPMFAVRELGRNRVFMFSALAALANYCATAGSAFLLSLYLQCVKGLAPREAGFMLLVQPVFQVAVAPLAGRMSDRIEPRFVASAGMAFTVAGLTALAFLETHTSMLVIISCLALLGVGFGSFSSPNTNAVMSSVDSSRFGVASATVGTMRLTGQVFSMGIVAFLLSANVGGAAVTVAMVPSFMVSLRTAYAAFAFLCLLGILASLARGRIRHAEETIQINAGGG